jgi:hypothetical protein
MSEPLAESLSRFSPDPGNLDRDALVFAAGRASARSGRPWIALAGALAASQLLTLLFLWPRAPAPDHPSEVRAITAPEGPPTPPDPASWWTLRKRALAGEEDLPAPTGASPSAPGEPPLRAFDTLPAALLN